MDAVTPVRSVWSPKLHSTDSAYHEARLLLSIESIPGVNSFNFYIQNLTNSKLEINGPSTTEPCDRTSHTSNPSNPRALVLCGTEYFLTPNSLISKVIGKSCFRHEASVAARASSGHQLRNLPGARSVRAASFSSMLTVAFPFSSCPEGLMSNQAFTRHSGYKDMYSLWVWQLLLVSVARERNKGLLVCVGIEDETKTGSINWPLGKLISKVQREHNNRSVGTGHSLEAEKDGDRFAHRQDRRVEGMQVKLMLATTTIPATVQQPQVKSVSGNRPGDVASFCSLDCDGDIVRGWDHANH
ncbi:hypothetical protein RRG08_036104 [Elysia crispata]|uniref:Uncharacterized protein n=1 Tax=Elysia crispata TaxID=231223 RepID=A0AAE1E0H8_9GAST|nr:hypothetical protein RRG08_036104 [Elysia crispata]